MISYSAFIVETFIQTLVSQGLLFLLFVGSVYALVWRIGHKYFAHRRIHTKRTTDRKQISSELRHTSAVLVVAAANGTAVIVLWKAGFTKIAMADMSSSFLYETLSIIGLIAFNDAWFYCCHRLMHHPKIFHRFHAIHHRSIDVNPFTSYSFHIVEALILSGWIVPFVIFVPLSIPTLGCVQVIGTINNIMSHLGYEMYPQWLIKVPILKWLNTATFHSLHHTHFNGNYGLFFRFWDHLFGTQIKNYEKQFLQRGSLNPPDPS